MDNQANYEHKPHHPPHMIFIAGLLVVIIGLQAMLWVRERRRRISAEQTAASLRHQNETLRGALKAISVGGRFGEAPATRPDDAPASRPASRPGGR